MLCFMDVFWEFENKGCLCSKEEREVQEEEEKFWGLLEVCFGFVYWFQWRLLVGGNFVFLVRVFFVILLEIFFFMFILLLVN